jgi:hypothetical protein
MFCVRCGALNPDDGAFCHKCGKELYRSDLKDTLLSAPTTTEAAAQEQATLAGAPAPKRAASSTASKAEAAYGWLFIVAAGLLLIIAVSHWAALEPPKSTSDRDLASFLFGGPTAEQQAKYERQQQLIVVALLQALLFGGTGLAILQAGRMAVTLVWVTVVLSGLGAVFRGLSPLELILWFAGAGLAAWYTQKRRPGYTGSAEHSPALTSTCPAGPSAVSTTQAEFRAAQSSLISSQTFPVEAPGELGKQQSHDDTAIEAGRPRDFWQSDDFGWLILYLLLGVVMLGLVLSFGRG